MRTREIPPKPSSLTESLQDIGYSLGTALADLIDNAITAGAANIQVLARTESPGFRVGILDDGIGMSEVELIEAMRLGSRSPLEERSPSDLGRFGLGLKTASFSQCRKLTVVTKRNGVTTGARWDLDRIANSNRWELELVDDWSSVPWLDGLGESGTLVLWEGLGIEAGEESQTELVRQLYEARAHLELVFHRFLSGEPGHPKLGILLNGRALEPFDPFHSGHPATNAEPVEVIRVAGHDIAVRAFTLPHHQKVTLAQWDRYAGTEGYLRSQGFYVYRHRRLIIHGTWFGLAKQTEQTKLARVRVDMPSALDKVWKIDVKKASAQLPPTVRKRLRRIIDKLSAGSKRVYTSRGKRLTEDNRVPVWSRIQDKGQILYRINIQHPMLADLGSRLPEETRSDFLKTIEVTGASLPTDALLADLGGDTAPLVFSGTSEEALRYAARTTFRHLVEVASSRDGALEMMRVAEPFKSNWPLTMRILDESNLKEQ